MRLLDLPQLPANRFTYHNAVSCLHIPTPCWFDLASGQIMVDPDFEVIGWCKKMDESLMHGREGQIGIMIFSKEDGEVWEHYPLYDEDDYKRASFRTK